MKNIDIKIVRGVPFVNGKRAKKIWTGSARRCFVANGVIIKVSQNYDTFKQSNTEIRIWKNVIEDHDKKYFAKPIDWAMNKNGGWIAQRIIKFKRGRRPLAAWKFVENIAERYGIMNDCFCSVDGFCMSANWGIRQNGRPVIYDWGY